MSLVITRFVKSLSLYGDFRTAEFTRVINANGEYVYHFADAAGNLTEKVVKVDSIIDKDLSLTYSLASDGTDSKESPDKLGRLKVGDTVYVSANKRHSRCIFRI